MQSYKNVRKSWEGWFGPFLAQDRPQQQGSRNYFGTVSLDQGGGPILHLRSERLNPSGKTTLTLMLHLSLQTLLFLQEKFDYSILRILLHPEHSILSGLMSDSTEFLFPQEGHFTLPPFFEFL